MNEAEMRVRVSEESARRAEESAQEAERRMREAQARSTELEAKAGKLDSGRRGIFTRWGLAQGDHPDESAAEAKSAEDAK
jgi:hypothetical protein